MPTHIGSRDLSEVFACSLEVTIIGIGTQTTDFSYPQDLATHAAFVFTKLTGQTFACLRPNNAPWKLVSLNRPAKQLIVSGI